MKKTIYTLFLIGVIIFSGIQIAKAIPNINILGNRAVVGTGLYATTTANAHLTASGTVAFISLGSAGNPCLTIGTDGKIATSTCGGGNVYVSTSTPFSAGYIPFATSSSAITNSNIFQSGSNIGIGTTTPSFLLEILGNLKVNTSSTLGNVISGVWNGTAITDSYISSAATWNAKITTSSLSVAYPPLAYDNITGVFSLSTSTASQSGFLSSENWTTFNNKQNTISFPIPVASTSLIAGRSLTLSTNQLDADAELFTDDFSFNVLNSTTTITGDVQKMFFLPITITEVQCSSDGSNITIGLDERASTTPDNAGVDVFNNGNMICSSNGNATSTFANASIAAGALISMDIDSVANSTTTLRVHVKFTKDD